MNFQSKHMENNSYEKLNSMTIVIAIKCNEGVVIATDNKGIARDFILQLKKFIQYMILGV
jgi:20S proteasome alpha/beta subunit